jgi:lysophospholipase L1-like esterase
MRLIKDAFAVLGIGVALFVLLNVIVAKFLLKSPPSAQQDVFSAVSWPGSSESLAIYRRVFNLSPTDDPMARFKASPTFAPHPALPFITASTDNQYFRVGIEGVRYEPGWTDVDVRKYLAERTTIFAFGGSTTFGHGLAGDETWPHYLGRTLQAQGGPIVLNFGAQAYDQATSLRKLIQVLKAGYRPSHVLFLDGWNDLFIARSNMRAEERVIYHGFSVAHGAITFTPGVVTPQPDYLGLALRMLPAHQLIQQWRQPPLSVESIHMGRDAYTEGFDFREADFVHRNWAALGEKYRAHFGEQLIVQYRANAKVLGALAREYGFRVSVFLQPIGLFDPTNPFVPAVVKNALGYSYMEEMFAALRAEAQTGTLVDISSALREMTADRYIDVAHYTPEANAQLARIIASHVHF